MTAKPKDKAEHQRHIDRNYEAFEERLDEYMLLHRDEYALMRNGEVVAFYLNVHDAITTGRVFYEDRLFSVQKVTKTPAYLGAFSHGMHHIQI